MPLPPRAWTGPEAAATSAAGPRTVLALLLTINLFNYIDRYVLAAVEPAIREEFFSGDEDAKAKTGMLATAFMVSYMATAPLFGWLADRVSRWRLMGIGVILWSLASGASGWSPTFLFLLITRCFMGLGEAAYGPAAPTIIADLYPKERRGGVMALFYMAIPVGSALGYALGGLMLYLISWRWAFYFDLPVGLLLGLFCFMMPEPRRGQSDQLSTTPITPSGSLAAAPLVVPALGGSAAAGNKEKPVGALAAVAVFFKTPSYVLNTLGMTAMTFAVGGISYWMPAYIWEERFNKTIELPTVTTIFGAIVVLAGLAATLLGGIAGDRLRPRYSGSYFLVSGVGMIIGFGCFLAFLVTPFPWAWVLVFAGVFCLFFNTGPTNTILVNVVHPSLRATGFAVNILIIHALGDAISPWIIGKIADRTSLGFGFLVVAGIILLSGLAWLWGSAYLERDTRLAASRTGR